MAWDLEMRQVHARLREALEVTFDALGDASPTAPAAADLLLFCRGFCSALDRHHRGEDRVLFPAVVAAHPQLRPVLLSLQRDHSMIAHLVAGLGEAARRPAPVEQLRQHLDGIAAVMENHFRYEERQLLLVLETLRLNVSRPEALGPL